MVIFVVRICTATRHPMHIEAAAIVIHMYLYSLALMDHPCPLGAAVCHQAPPCPLYTQPRARRVWARRTNGVKIASTSGIRTHDIPAWLVTCWFKLVRVPCQCLLSLFLKAFAEGAFTILSGRSFHTLTTLLLKTFARTFNLNLLLCNLKEWPLVAVF